MVAENIIVTTSGVGVSEEEATRGATVSVLVAYDSANDTYVPVSCSPEGYIFTSGVN